MLGAIPLDPNKEPSFFQTDLWHNWHNGLAKYFVGNALCTFITTHDLIPARSIDSKFEWLTQDYLSFCQRSQLTPFLREINRDTISFESAASPPQGMWNKAVVSTHLMLYVADFCSRFVKGKTEDYILKKIVSRTKQGMRFFCCFSLYRFVSLCLGIFCTAWHSVFCAWDSSGEMHLHHEHLHRQPLLRRLLDAI